MNKRGPKPDPERLAKCIALFNKNNGNYTETAKELGVKPQSIFSLFKRWDVVVTITASMPVHPVVAVLKKMEVPTGDCVPCGGRGFFIGFPKKTICKPCGGTGWKKS